MPTNVRIGIIGMCLCFRKEYPPKSASDPVWNVIFPCDPRHYLNLTFPQPDAKPNGSQRPAGTVPLHPVPGPDLDIEFHRADTSSVQCTYDSTFGDLLNLAETRLHGVKPNPKHSKLSLLRRKQHCDEAWMRVPHSELSVAPPDSSKNCWLWEVNPVGRPLPRLPVCRPPKSDRITLELDVADKIRLTVRNKTTGEYVFDETFSGPSVELEFDNKCLDNDGHNDFLNIYESLDDELTPGKRFATAKHPFPCIVPATEADFDQNFLKELEALVMTPQANCDPVGSEPPPGP